MILPLLVAASVSAAPAVASETSGHLLAGASHALRANRLDQATVMVARAVEAGASGPALDRVMADLAYAKGNFAEALGTYEQLLKSSPRDQALLEPAAISAIKVGKLDRASSFLTTATSEDGASWRVWNACGVVADETRNWSRADQCYQQSIKLAPREAGPINNEGWSMLLRGNWQQALELFEQATMLDPRSERIADNLELAQAALASDLPTRKAGESDSAWAARLNDAGVAAVILGNKTRATAAFTQALDASGTWYARAANNLETLGGR